MSEWVSVLAVFWVLWALDGVRLGPRRLFTFVGGCRRARIGYSRVSLPGLLPTSWRMTTADVPLSLSPLGVSNRLAGAAGRPAEGAEQVRAWRWEDVREVGVARGWVHINGQRFCPDTQHLRAVDLLELARLPAVAREKRIRTLVKLWFRPGHLRRRVRVLRARTALAARLNAIVLVVLLGITAYVAGDVASRLPERWSARLADSLPWLLLGLLALHMAGVVLAWRAMRRLRRVVPEKRGANLFSALMLPPQAMRLRSILGDGFFPAQHPLAAAVAFAEASEQSRWAFQALADLRWPNAVEEEPAAAREIAAWFREELERRLLAVGGFNATALLAAPKPDGRMSCSYCPRCRDQFVAGVAVCPNGVALQPLQMRERT